MGGINFTPDKDIPDLSGKVIFITGGPAPRSSTPTTPIANIHPPGTAGIGSESVFALSKHNPAHVYFSGRNSQTAAALIQSIEATSPNVKITFLECDLASLASVKASAARFTEPRLDVLMCNAGIMTVPPALTTDGYEITFGTNHLGHALLIKLLLPTLVRTAELPDSDVRIVILTSQGFRMHPTGGIMFKDLRTVQDGGMFSTWRCYGQSKLANILYANELARRYPKITAVSIHPGVVSTGLVGNLGFAGRLVVYVSQLGMLKTPAEGAYNQLWAATGKKGEGGVVSGAYYEPIGVPGSHDKESKSQKLAEELWEWTQKELEPY